MNQTFYIVWNQNGQNPTYRHDSEEQAIEEAERLSLLNPGQDFIVMRAVSISRHRTVETIRFGDPNHDLPF